MHNGSFQTLEEVMEFYNRGGGAGMGLDIPHQTLPPDPLGLTEREKADILAFMHTLTDTSGLMVDRVVLPEAVGGAEAMPFTIVFGEGKGRAQTSAKAEIISDIQLYY